MPSWATFDTTTAELSGTPPLGSAGTYHLTVTASIADGSHSSATLTVPIIVRHHDATPQLTGIANQTLEPGQVVDVPVQASVDSTDRLVLTAAGLNGYLLPAFASLTDNHDGTGRIHLRRVPATAATTSSPSRQRPRPARAWPKRP